MTEEEAQLASLISRFRGCLVGALVGDCFGEPFQFLGRVTLESVKRFVNNVEAEKSERPQILLYTDDTEMRLGIEESLLKEKEFNARDMAKRFAEEYFANNRNYGYHVTRIFKDWSSKDLEDVYEPASKQFNGTGSYGNGGGMRIAPAALFMYKEPQEKLIDLTDKITQLTHTHKLGILGAYLQVLAVDFALKTTESPFPKDKFLHDLTESMIHHEEVAFGKTVSDPPAGSELLYSQKLKIIKEFLEESNVEKKKLVQVLGNDVTALGSIPISIYAFLRALSDIDGLEGRNSFERTIIYSISLDGDTDTIATMAGAIAGAYWGEESIPKKWQQSCEGLAVSQKHASSLYDFVKKH